MKIHVTTTTDVLPFLESQRDTFLVMADAYGAAAEVLSARIAELQAARDDA